MSYVVLARKWRPMSFRDLIGQEHVSRSLANAIEQDRVAHAFLFTGVRGVGKTTSARILAKALNCLRRAAPGAAPGLEPCLECAACTEIAEGIDVDVREIDGASYTGVDEIRKLQESLPYRPSRDRYKIFIVDEVHMLSQNAWNALLKTLEEPPPHVKFILATTEVHKVPVTILSRVQRFDFKMIPSRLIGERIRFVLEAERIEADDRAVQLVAREAAGSMRDALSLLDQVIAFNPERLLGDEVARVLGVAGYLSLLELAGCVLRGEPAKALSAVDALARQGSDLIVAARNLVALFRDLVVAKLCAGSDELLDLSDEERGEVRALAERTDAQDLVRLQQGFAKSFDDVSRAAEPRTALEMLLTRLALRPALVPLDALLARLGELEARLESGRAPPSGNPGRSGPTGGAPRSGGARPAPSNPSASPSPTNTAPAPVGAAPVSAAPVSAAPVSAPVSAAPVGAAPVSVAPAHAVPANRAPANPAPVAATTAAAAPADRAPTGAALAPAARANPAPAGAAAAAAPADPAPPSVPSSSAPSLLRSEGAAARTTESPALRPQQREGVPAVAAPVAAAPAAAPASMPPASRPTAAPGAAAAPVAFSEPGTVLSLDDWRSVLDCLRNTRPDLVAFLKHAQPLRLTPELFTLGYEAGNALEASLRSADCLRELKAAATKCLGREPNIVFQAAAPGAETLAELDKKAREKLRKAALDRAEQHPSVKDAAEILGARVKRIELGEI